MVTRIQKWGNSQGLRIPKEVLEEARVSVGDEVDVAVDDGTILVRPVRRVRGRHKLQDLLAQIPKGYQAEEADWGRPHGKESW